MEIPDVLAAEMAIAQQNIALSMVKNAAETSQKIADILMQSAANVPASGIRGTQVNFSA